MNEIDGVIGLRLSGIGLFVGYGPPAAIVLRNRESKRAVKEKNKSFSLFLFSFNYSHYCSHTLSQQRREERERVGFPLFLHSLIGV